MFSAIMVMLIPKTAPSSYHSREQELTKKTMELVCNVWYLFVFSKQFLSMEIWK